MFSRVARGRCPRCSQWVIQAANPSGPNVCPNCGRLFFMSVDEKTPPWIWGVLLVLAAKPVFHHLKRGAVSAERPTKRAAVHRDRTIATRGTKKRGRRDSLPGYPRLVR